MTREEQIALLTQGEISLEGRIQASSNQALLVSVTLGEARSLACYKAEAGERLLWDFEEGLWRREVAAYELATLLGVDLVPLTIAREDAPFGWGSLQMWIEEATDDHYFTLRERPEFTEWFVDLCIFDILANNADRKGGHILFDGARCWAIDNGLCFHEEDKLRTVIWDFTGRPLSEQWRARLATFIEGAGTPLLEWLSADEVTAVVHRANWLLGLGQLPEPDEEADWPPYPWPLV
jgi:uncharacterized repeat protein (TIGR03843 family)